eukprot:6179670-Pleurochrysis_carterae.AAC.1
MDDNFVMISLIMHKVDGHNRVLLCKTLADFSVSRGDHPGQKVQPDRLRRGIRHISKTFEPILGLMAHFQRLRCFNVYGDGLVALKAL